jgi:hypothetical protein
MTSTAPLTGEALKAKVAEMSPAPESVIAMACGYVTKVGKARIAAFKDALLVAHGLGLQKEPGGETRGRGLSWRGKATGKGGMVLSGGYGALIGLEPGGEYLIVHSGDQLIIQAAGSGAANGVAPFNADAVTTYDSIPVAA